MKELTKTTKKQASFLTEVALFVLIMGFAIASALTLAIEPFCKEFGVLCDAGFFQLVYIGLGISTAFTVLSAVAIYICVRFWPSKN